MNFDMAIDKAIPFSLINSIARSTNTSLLVIITTQGIWLTGDPITFADSFILGSFRLKTPQEKILV